MPQEQFLEWTNTNPGARANLTGGTGPFAIADSDKCGSGSTMDTTMSTGILDMTGLTNPRVRFNMDYDDLTTGGTTDSAILEASTDGGATWTPVRTWDADARGPLVIDEALPGAGENDVKVRWNYHGVWAWWWEVDNAFITACEPIPTNPAISLDKTVGTDPLVCATTDEITLPAGGGEVTYCYEVTNTGDVTLTRHDLVDSELGALLNNFTYSLAPGASVFLTATTNIAVTTVNTATWTAYNPARSTVGDGDRHGDGHRASGQHAGDHPEQDRRHRARCLRDDQQGHRAVRHHVYYCYQIENTGNVTMTVHSLVDDQLGTLANNLPYVLPPGGFSPQVIVPDTAVITVTNTATWTAASGVGYVVNTNAAFNYIPINTTGTALLLADDGEANITIPWGATFFGATSSDLRVGNNGGILFGVTTGDLGLTNAALPTAAGLPAPAILPFWDDIDSDTGDVYWEVQGTSPNRMLIVEWYNRPHFSNIGSVTFEAILYEATNEIKYQYADVDFGDPLYSNGASATVGINKNATTALQVSFNQPVIQNGQAILFTPAAILTASDSDFAEVNVRIPNIDVDPLSMSATQATNTTTNQTLERRQYRRRAADLGDRRDAAGPPGTRRRPGCPRAGLQRSGGRDLREGLCGVRELPGQ